MPKFSDSPAQNWENPVLVLEKSLRRCPSLHFHMDGKWKISVKCSFWKNPSLNVPESCFSAGLLNDPISWAASNHKMSEALSSQKTGWSSSFPLLPPQLLPSTKSHQQNITHACTLLLPIHPKTSQNWTLQKLAGSLDDWIFFSYTFYETDDHYPFRN